MKPPPFRYHRPTSVAEVVSLLDELADDGKLLAGGQSLVPVLNFRLFQPKVLIDLNYVQDSVPLTINGSITVGSLVRQRELEHSAQVAATCSLLPQALAHVGHPAIRNRGTICGSVAHADPAAELAAALVAIGGTLVATTARGSREIDAAEFFLGPFRTALEPNELLTEIRFNRIQSSARTAFLEVARRQGDFALCAVAAIVDGENTRVALAGVEPAPRQFSIDPAGEAAEDIAASLETHSDIHASAGFRRQLARTLIRRALAAARTEGARS